jgi:hypothetical protein
MGKGEFHLLCGVMQGWFWAKLGLKNHDGPQQSEQFLWPPPPPRTCQTGTNHSYSSIWIQQTSLYGQGRVSFALWYHAGLILSQTWVEKPWWTPAVGTTPVATDSPRDISNRNKRLWWASPPNFNKGAPFLNRAFVGHVQLANHARCAPQMSCKCPAWSSYGSAKSRKVQHMVLQGPADAPQIPATSRNVRMRSRYFDWPCHPRLPVSSSTMAVFIDSHPSNSQRIHHRHPSVRVWGSAVMYSRWSTTSPQRFVWQKVARGSSCFVVMGREVSSRTIGIAPRINKFDRIKLIVHYKYSITSLLHKWT